MQYLVDMDFSASPVWVRVDENDRWEPIDVDTLEISIELKKCLVSYGNMWELAFEYSIEDKPIKYSNLLVNSVIGLGIQLANSLSSEIKTPVNYRDYDNTIKNKFG